MLKNIRKNKKKKNESSIIGRLRRWFYHGRFIGFDIQSIIMTVLTALTIITTVIMGLLLYNRFKMAIKQTAVTNTENMVENTVEKLDADLLNVRQITNADNLRPVNHRSHDECKLMLSKRKLISLCHYNLSVR